MDDLQQHISTLEEDVKQKIEKLRQTQNPRFLTPQHSTPKEQPRNLTDSGIAQTRRTDFGDVTERTVQTQLQRADDAPTLFGPYVSEHEQGARSKQGHYKTTSATPGTSSGGSVEISPILRPSQRNAKQAVNNQEKVRTPGKNTRREIKLANYDGSGEWVDFKSHFEACAIINNWDEYEQGLYLAAALRGHAQSVFSDLPTDKKMNYETLVKSLEERFAPPNQNELYRVQLKERRQRASETLPELGQTIRRLVNRAYPLAPTEVKETLSKDYFLDALHDSEMRIKIKQSRPQNLNQAICLAVELEAFYKAEKRQDFVKPQMRATHADNITEELSKDDKFTEMMDSFTKQLESLRMELNEFKNSGQRNTADPEWKRNQQCYNCGKYGHFKRECRLRKQGGNGNGQYRNHENGSARPVHSRTRRQRRKQIKLNVQNNSTKEAGAYIDVAIGNIKASFLVDTGATVTLISNKLFNSLRKEEMPNLNQVVQTIMSANGSELNVTGKGEFHIWIDHNVYLAEAVVADLALDGIIGLDFLKKNRCLINLQEEHMVCNNQVIPLNFTGQLGCYRVSVVEDTCIQPGTEALVRGHINEYPSTKNEVGLGIIEPCDKFVAKDSALMARTLVKASETVPLRFMNVSNVVKIIRAGTIVGNISPIQDVISDDKNITDIHKDQNLRIELQKLLSNCSENLSQEQKRGVENLLNEYKDLFAASDRDLGRTNLVRHTINTGNNAPVKQPPRRTPIHMREEVDRHIDDMLERGVIEPADGPWSSGIVLVKKKDGTTRFCVDYRKVNDLTVKDAYPLPRIDDSLEQLSGNKWFSTLDLCSGYWQVEMAEKDRPKTAFASRRGLFQFRQMPFGLACAPATFERLMERVLAGLQWSICLVYLDDIIVVGKSFEEMLENLRSVFDRLKGAGLKLKPKKCTLFSKKVNFLGHVVTEEGVATDPEKIKSIKDWPIPVDASELRSFLGLCGYYRRYIEHFAKIAKCLHQLTEKGRKYLWTEECQEAFQALKGKLTKAPILAHPDLSRPFILDTDASNNAIGAVLSQEIDGKERVIAFGSRTLSKTERKYCVTRKELLSVVHFVKSFRHFLYGRAFIVRTDHSSLQWLLNFKNAEGQLARWLEVLSTYDMKIKHRPGSQHQNADALSRIPCRQCGYSSDWKAQQLVQTVSSKPDECERDKEDDTEISLKHLQDNDKNLQIVRQWVQDGHKPNLKNLGEYNYVIKSLWSQFDDLKIQDGVLCKVHRDNNKSRVIVPLTERRRILQQCHDNKTSGHLGIKKTQSRIKDRFYWPGVRHDIVAYIAGCEICAKRKGPNKRQRAPMQLQKSGYPMERIAMDILGELPETERGHKYILVISDYYSKWTESFPMPNMLASTVANILVAEVITRFGVPTVVHSDQGSQFESELFQEMCHLLQIDKTRTTPYHPQCDGMVERFNGTLAKMLTAYVDEHHSNWDCLLPYVMMAYRSAQHETTGCTPNRMMLGREVATPVDLMYDVPDYLKKIPQNRWAWELQERMEEAHHFVRKHVGQEMVRQKKYYDKQLNWCKFRKDDQVYVFFPIRKAGHSPKFTSYWRGPFRVLKEYSDVNYLINCGRRGRPQVIHVDRMRLCKGQHLRGETEMNELEIQDDAFVPESVLPEIFNEELDSADNIVDQSDSRDESGYAGRPRRVTKQPAWLHDFVR